MPNPALLSLVNLLRNTHITNLPRDAEWGEPELTEDGFRVVSTNHPGVSVEFALFLGRVFGAINVPNVRYSGLTMLRGHDLSTPASLYREIERTLLAA